MLKLLSEEELRQLEQADIKKQKLDNAENDYDYPNQMDRYTRKWQYKIRDAKPYWNKIYTLSNEKLLMVVNWLSTSEEPCNPGRYGCGRPATHVRLARAIKYEMTPKQREIAYKIIEAEYIKRKIDIVSE